MHSSHHSSMNPPYMGQAPNTFLNSASSEQFSDKELQGTAGFQRAPTSMSTTQSLFSPQHDEYPDEVMDSPDPSNVSCDWDDFGHTPWDMPVNLPEHHASDGRVPILQPLHMHHDAQFDATRSHARYHQVDHPLMPATSSISGASPMSYSTSASPAPEVKEIPFPQNKHS